MIYIFNEIKDFSFLLKRIKYLKMISRNLILDQELISRVNQLDTINNWFESVHGSLYDNMY